MKNKMLYYSCFYAFLYCGIIMMTIGSALPDVSSAYNLSHSMSGALLSCYSLGNLASGVFWAFIALYLGQKLAIVILILLVVMGLSALALTHLHIILFTACVLIGLGRGSIVSFTQRTINIFTDGDPGVIGALHATFAAGAIIAPLIFSALRIISWRVGIIFVAVLGLIALITFALIKDYSLLDGSNSGNNNKSLAFLRNKGFLIIAALMFLYLCCEFALNGWLVTYMHYKNMTLRYAHLMAALLWVVMLIGRLACARLAKFISQKNIMLYSSIGAAIFFTCMLACDNEITIALSVACLGLCMAGISPIIYSTSAPYTNKYNLAMGILFTLGCTGGTLMPFVTGLVAEYYGFDGGMSAILVTFILLIIFALINKNWTHEA